MNRLSADDLPRWVKAALLALTILAVMLLAPMLIHAEPAYVPLTHDQAARYIDANREGAIADIIKLDYIEHVAPSSAVPGILVAVRGNDVLWSWQGPVIVVLPGLTPGEPDALHLSVGLRDGEAKGVVVSHEGELWLWRGATIVAAVLFYEVGHQTR